MLPERILGAEESVRMGKGNRRSLRSHGFPVETRGVDELHASLYEETLYLRESP